MLCMKNITDSETCGIILPIWKKVNIKIKYLASNTILNKIVFSLSLRAPFKSLSDREREKVIVWQYLINTTISH